MNTQKIVPMKKRLKSVFNGVSHFFKLEYCKNLKNDYVKIISKSFSMKINFFNDEAEIDDQFCTVDYFDGEDHVINKKFNYVEVKDIINNSFRSLYVSNIFYTFYNKEKDKKIPDMSDVIFNTLISNFSNSFLSRDDALSIETHFLSEKENFMENLNNKKSADSKILADLEDKFDKVFKEKSKLKRIEFIQNSIDKLQAELEVLEEENEIFLAQISLDPEYNKMIQLKEDLQDKKYDNYFSYLSYVLEQNEKNQVKLDIDTLSEILDGFDV